MFNIEPGNKVAVVKKYIELHKARTLTPEDVEILAALSGDPLNITHVFDHISSGEKMPDNWEELISKQNVLVVKGGTRKKSTVLALDNGTTVAVSKAEKPADEPKHTFFIKAPKKKCNKCGGTNYSDIRAGLGDCCINKALPKKDKSSEPAKKTKTSKASKKTVGKTGKERSSYPGDKGGDKPKQPGPPQPKANPAQVPDEQEGPPTADPSELANILNVSVQTLTKTAERFRDEPKMGGRSGFVSFCKTKLKHMAAKHKLDGDYFGLIFDALCPKKPNQ